MRARLGELADFGRQSKPSLILPKAANFVLAPAIAPDIPPAFRRTR